MSGSRLLPDGVLRQARRRGARVPADLAGALGSGVRALDESHLRRLMAFPPTRRAVLETIFRSMPRALDRRRADGVELSVRWAITRSGGERADVYDLTVADGRAHVRRGSAAAARVTITVDGVEFLRLVTGATDPMRAYMSGELAATGDIMAAARMASLFRVPRAGRAGKQNANTKPPVHRAY